MDEKQKLHFSELKESYRKHLNKLELQAAKFGSLYVPPYILLEIDELHEKISSIDEAMDGINCKNDAKKKRNTVKVLFVSANPIDMPNLQLDVELREIQQNLDLSTRGATFEFYSKVAVQPTDLTRELLKTQPNIVHFSGHGSSYGGIYLENQAGKAQLVETDVLSMLFEQFSDQIDCVILNCCFSEKQAESISKHIKFVIGMDKQISDEASSAFSIGFYQALSEGRSIEEAYSMGRIQIPMQGFLEFSTPVLFKKMQNK